VLPVFLWGKLKGFAFTTRSHFEYTEEIDIIISSNLNIKSIENIEEISIDKDIQKKNKKKFKLKIPKNLKTSCFLYTVWWVETFNRIFFLSLNPSSLNIISNKKGYDTFIEIIESFATFPIIDIYKKNNNFDNSFVEKTKYHHFPVYYLNNNDNNNSNNDIINDGNNNNKNKDNNNNINNNSNNNNNINNNNNDNNNNINNNSNNNNINNSNNNNNNNNKNNYNYNNKTTIELETIKVREVLKLKNNRSYIEEFFYIQYIQLFTIRNGFDLDWINMHLPQVFFKYTIFLYTFL
jgi:hypothetical protein